MAFDVQVIYSLQANSKKRNIILGWAPYNVSEYVFKQVKNTLGKLKVKSLNTLYCHVSNGMSYAAK